MRHLDLIELYHFGARELRVLQGLAEQDMHMTYEQRADALSMTRGHFQHAVDDLYTRLAINEMRVLVMFAQWVESGQRPQFEEDGKHDIFTCPAERNGCGETKRITAFPVWPIDHRCSECIKLNAMSARRYERRLRAEKALASMLEHLNAQWIELPHINNVIAGVINYFGGVEEYVKMWCEQIELAKKDKPGSKYVLDALRDISRLLAQANDMNSDISKNIEELNEEETRKYIVNVVLRQLAIEGKEQLLDLFDQEEAAPEAAESKSA